MSDYLPAWSDGYREARNLSRWYAMYCSEQKVRYQASEVVLLIVSATVPVVGILVPDDARWPAILGAVVTTLVGLRGLFHWRENWLHGAVALANIVAEMRSYSSGVPPYDDPSSRDSVLITRVNEIDAGARASFLSAEKPDEEAGTLVGAAAVR